MDAHSDAFGELGEQLNEMGAIVVILEDGTTFTGHNPFRVGVIITITQGSSFVATLGFADGTTLWF